MTRVCLEDALGSSPEECYAIAQACAALGWRVMPLGWNKRPVIKGWPRLATIDLDRIEEWWCGQYIGCPVGILTGPESGIWVLDIDVKRVNGLATVRDLFAARGLTQRPATFTVRTPSGGEHWYFAYPTDGRQVGNTASRQLGPGVDSRGWHGMVVAPYVHLAGIGRYEIVDPTAPVPAPRWLEDLVERKRRQPVTAAVPITLDLAREALDAEVGQLATTRSGGRNQALNAAAFGLGLLARTGALDRATARAALLGACRANGLLGDDGAEQCGATFDSGWEAGMTAQEAQT